MPLSHFCGRSGLQQLPKLSREYRFNQKRSKSGAKSNIITNVSSSMRDMPFELKGQGEFPSPDWA